MKHSLSSSDFDDVNSGLASFLNHQQNFDTSSWSLNPFPESDSPSLAELGLDDDGLFKTVDHHHPGKEASSDHVLQFTSNTAQQGSKQRVVNPQVQQQQHGGSFFNSPQQSHHQLQHDFLHEQHSGNNNSCFFSSPELLPSNGSAASRQGQGPQFFQQQYQQPHPHQQYNQQHFEENDATMEDLPGVLLDQLDDMNKCLSESSRMDIDNEEYIDQYQKKRKRKASVISMRGLSAKSVKQNNHERTKSHTWMEQEIQSAQNRVNQFGDQFNVSYQHPIVGAFLHQQHQQFDASSGMLSTSAPSVMSNRDRPPQVYHQNSMSQRPSATTVATQQKKGINSSNGSSDKPARGAIANLFSHFWPQKRKEDSVSLPSDEQGAVSLTSKMVKYSVFTMDGLLWIRKFKCLALEVKVPFQLPDTLPTIEYKLKVKQKDSESYFGVITHEFVEYEFNGFNAQDNVTSIPESAIDRSKQTLRIPFKLTKGQKEIVGGYKNTFKLQFTIKWSDTVGVSVWFSYRCDSRGKDEKNSYTRVSHICGHNQVWYQTTKGKENKVDSSDLDEETPVICMVPRIVLEDDDRGLKENKNQV